MMKWSFGGVRVMMLKGKPSMESKGKTRHVLEEDGPESGSRLDRGV